MCVFLVTGLNCTCHSDASMEIIYDNIFRNPICVQHNCSSAINCTKPFNVADIDQKCSTLLLREKIVSTISMKSIQIYSDPITNCTSDHNIVCPTNYVYFQKYCIPLSLLSDYFNYKQFKSIQSNVQNIYANLEYLVFFCQTMHITIYCEYIANLCVLSQYNLDRYSPCNIFYASQSTVVSANGFNARLTPFLFYAKGKSTIDDLDKIIDHRYRYGNKNDDYYMDENILTDEISMIMVGHSIDGDLKAIESLRLQQFNFCADKYIPDAIHFGQDLVSSCHLKLNDLIKRGEERPWIMNLYLNYTENRVNLMKAVPVLIRNAFTHNMVCKHIHSDFRRLWKCNLFFSTKCLFSESI